MKISIHKGLLLHLFVLCLFCFNTPYQFTPLHNLHSHFWFNTLWLAVSYYASPLFLMRILFLIYIFLIYAQFSGTQLAHKTRPLCPTAWKKITLHWCPKNTMWNVISPIFWVIWCSVHTKQTDRSLSFVYIWLNLCSESSSNRN
jgi:hypothetical protein